MPTASRISIRSLSNNVDEPGLHAAVIVIAEDVAVDEVLPEIKRRRSAVQHNRETPRVRTNQYRAVRAAARAPQSRREAGATASTHKGMCNGSTKRRALRVRGTHLGDRLRGRRPCLLHVYHRRSNAERRLRNRRSAPPSGTVTSPIASLMGLACSMGPRPTLGDNLQNPRTAKGWSSQFSACVCHATHRG